MSDDKTALELHPIPGLQSAVLEWRSGLSSGQNRQTLRVTPNSPIEQKLESIIRRESRRSDNHMVFVKIRLLFNGFEYSYWRSKRKSHQKGLGKSITDFWNNTRNLVLN